MSRLHRGTGAAVILLSVMHFAHGGCAEVPYTGGSCSDDADCTTYFQNLPGTVCTSGRCECQDPSHHLCCALGEADDPDCFAYCRPCDECATGTPGCPPACVPGTEGCPTTACQADDDCAGPPDPRCGAGRCVDGECAVEIDVGPLLSQLRGDCKREECTVSGEVVTVEDVGDYYDDGKQCTYDSCAAGASSNASVPDGITCPVAGAGRCLDGECVQCWQGDPNMTDCGAGLACDGLYCVPLHCINTQKDAGETDIDCGGACQPCPSGRGCATGADCKDGVCNGGVCKLPSCSDGVKNDTETGVDCGAPSCPLCPPGQGCATGDDCTSGVCWAGACEEPSCFDGVRNGDESGVDCGGSCAPCP